MVQATHENLTPWKFWHREHLSPWHLDQGRKIYYGKNLCVHAYHVYQDIIWEAAVEACLFRGAAAHSWQVYTVAVKNNGTVIRHLQRKVPCACSLFLKQCKWGWFALVIADGRAEEIPEESKPSVCRISFFLFVGIFYQQKFPHIQYVGILYTYTIPTCV